MPGAACPSLPLLRCTEQCFCRLGAGPRLADALQHFDAALHYRARVDFIEPAQHVRKIADFDTLILPGAGLRECGEVGDHVFAACKVAVAGLLVIHDPK